MKESQKRTWNGKKPTRLVTFAVRNKAQWIERGGDEGEGEVEEGKMEGGRN